ncbi:YraN family protein [Pseudaestuariivita sp.]|uniref:YraN family protein n=1 Tax=Pseudaestuariivita sp. TaxID=2211669 RepID=UPI00405A3124
MIVAAQSARPQTARQHRGAVAYHRGLSAEQSVARDYESRGCEVASTRWTGGGGEIDLIVQDASEIVFVEVKAARSHAEAAERLHARQMQRIALSAAEYLDTQPGRGLTPARFDVALVDGQGRVSVIENAFGCM